MKKQIGGGVMVENRVGIFSLTDHNIINVDAYAEYYRTYNGEEDPLLLIGVELSEPRGV